MARSDRRRLGSLRGGSLAVALTVLAPAAFAQQAPAAGVTRAPVPAVAAPAAAPEPVVEPPYDPSQHGGLSEAVWLRATRGTARRSTGMMITGIGFITLAASLMAAGTGVYVNDNGCQGDNNACNGGKATGMALLAAGLISLGLGLPLTIHGASDVPRAEAGSALRGGERPSFTIGLGAQGATVALRF